MGFLSLSFLGMIFATIFVSSFNQSSRIRGYFLLVLSILFCSSYLSLLQSCIILGFAGLGYIFYCLRAKKAVTRNLSVALLFSAILVIYLSIKGYIFSAALDGVSIVGISYVVFRIVHLMGQATHQDQVLISPVDYLNYLFFFPSFVSGPVQSFDEFKACLETDKKPVFSDWESLIARMVMGYFKLFFLSVWLFGISDLLLSFKPDSGGTSLIHAELIFNLGATSLAYVLGIYINFSGYMDIMVPLAKIMGIALQENFNHPLSSENFVDLWKRWHISVSNWFRDQIFNPLFKWLATIAGAKNRRLHPYIAVFCLMISFTIMGFWHGVGLHYFLYGVLLGIGICATTIFSIWKTKKKLSHAKSWQGKLPARAITFTYFSASLLFLKYDTDLLSKIWQNGSYLDFVLSTASVFFGWLILMAIHDLAVLLYKNILTGWSQVDEKVRVFLIPVWSAIFIYWCIFFSLHQGGYVPMDVLYKVF